MNVVLVRGRENDSAVFRYYDALKVNGSSVSLVLWNRSKNREVLKNRDSIINIDFESPTDTVTAIFFLPFWWALEFTHLLRLKPRIVGAFDVDTAIPALIVAKIMRARLTYIMLDYSPDCTPPGTPRLITKAMLFIERLMLHEADQVVLVDESRIDQIDGRMYMEKIHIIHNIPLRIDNNTFKYEKPSRSVVELFYAGILHKTRGVEIIIDSIIKSEFAILTIAGKGPLEEYVKERALQYSNKINYVGQIDHEEVMKHTMRADAIIGFYDPTIRNNTYASPNRFFEAMVCSKPLITNKGISIANIIENHDSGYIIEYGDEVSLTQLIDHIRLNRDELKKKGDNAKELFNTKYSSYQENMEIIKAFSYYDK